MRGKKEEQKIFGKLIQDLTHVVQLQPATDFKQIVHYPKKICHILTTKALCTMYK